MSSPELPQQQPGTYEASSLVVSRRPDEIGFPLREEEFQILCEGEIANARASRDLFCGLAVGAAVGLLSVFATTDWAVIWQPEKRKAFLLSVAFLLVGTFSSAVAAIIFQIRVRKTRTDSAYARVADRISRWFTNEKLRAESK